MYNYSLFSNSTSTQNSKLNLVRGSINTLSSRQQKTCKSPRQSRIFFLLGMLVLFIAICLPSMVSAANVTLAWDAGDPAAEGYRVFMRAESQDYNFSAPAWTGTGTSCSVDQLSGNTYYFVVRAFQGVDESLNSNEVAIDVVVNQAPEANAGPDQSVEAGVLVALDGAGSLDPDGGIATFKWVQTAGPALSLNEASSFQAFFTAPSATAGSTVIFELTVTDSEGLTATDTCEVSIIAPAQLDSDGDGLTDDDEINLYGTDPNNADTDNDGITDAQEVSAGTDPVVDDSVQDYAKIWIEAEDGDIYSPMTIADDPEASAQGYIQAPNGSGYHSSASKEYGYSEYTFVVPSAGNYIVWGRVLAASGQDDSFFVSMDNGLSALWDVQMSDSWVWDQLVDRGQTEPASYYLTAGTHTLTVYQREDGSKLDRILITNDMEYIPEALGEQVVQSLDKVWIEAEDGDIYAPMMISDNSEASAQGYIEAPNGSGYPSGPSKSYGYAEYTFEVSTSGDYIVWGRVLAANGKDDSFFVSMDNGSSVLWDVQMSDSWVWDQLVDRGQSSAATFYLTAGTHTLTVYQREDGSKLDRILITNDMEYIPEAMGEEVASTVHKLFIEAEDGYMNAPMAAFQDTDASAKGYIEAPNGSGYLSGPSKSNGYAEYTFEVPTSGDYIVWGRVLAANGKDDSFFVSMDNGSSVLWDVQMSGSWIWDQLVDRGETSAATFYLTAGTHTLTVYQREDGSKLDKILITNDMEYTP
ncbi:MAG: hypothetical protein GY874_02630 [Desulfobacteraceae bacterium]|nr:hypothetical protein [Desulfobacteraceae bacterium]